MTQRSNLNLGAAALVVLFLAACGSSGGLGDILGGGGSGGQTNNVANEIRGTVDSVDTQGRSILLTNVSGYTNMLSSGGGSGSSVRVYFENNTQVVFQGQSHRPEDLERGDEVLARVEQSGNRLIATSMQVTYDSSGGGTNAGAGGYGTPTTLRGTVRNIDTSRRTIEIDRGYNTATTLYEYDNNTYVTFNNRQYQVADLERGDEIEIRASDLGRGRLMANNIDVIRSVSSGASTNSQRYATVRGTVRYHDANRRTIELEQASWINNFNTNTGNTTAGILTIQYAANATVNVNGQNQAVGGLERGDVIEVETQTTTGTTLFADRIMLVRDVNIR
jgi:hypothetical protein